MKKQKKRSIRASRTRHSAKPTKQRNVGRETREQIRDRIMAFERFGEDIAQAARGTLDGSELSPSAFYHAVGGAIEDFSEELTSWPAWRTYGVLDRALKELDAALGPEEDDFYFEPDCIIEPATPEAANNAGTVIPFPIGPAAALENCSPIAGAESAGPKESSDA